MFNQSDFGKRVKEFRTRKNYSQKEIALRIGVSEQAVSKWENGDCLPDIYNLKLLAQILHISVDSLLDTEMQDSEKIIETVNVCGAHFDIVEKPETILAGKIIYAKDFSDIDSFYSEADALAAQKDKPFFDTLKEIVLPVYDINLSVNFWLDEQSRAYGVVREVMTEDQPAGTDIYKVPASLYIRAYTDKETSRIVCKEQCEIWELFSYIRNHFMPSYNFKMAQNRAQEMEKFDMSDHRSGYAYMPVQRAED